MGYYSKNLIKQIEVVFIIFLFLFLPISFSTMVRAQDEYLTLSLSSDDILIGDTTDVTLGIKGTEETITKTIPVEVVLVIDISGSMLSDINNNFKGPSENKKLYKAREAAKVFLSNMAENENNVLSIVSFGHTATEELPLTVLDSSGVVTSEDVIDNLRGCGSTNYYLGLRKAKEILDTSSNTEYNKVIVFMSDGKPTTSNLFPTSGMSDSDCTFSINYNAPKTVDGDSYRCDVYHDKSFMNQAAQSDIESSCSYTSTQSWDKDAARAGASLVNSAGYTLYTIGFGGNTDNNLLREMVDYNSDYYNSAPNGDSLSAIYDSISKEVTSVVASNVETTFEIPEDIEYVANSYYQTGSTDSIELTQTDNLLKWNLGIVSKAQEILLHFKLLPKREAENPPFTLGENSYTEYYSPDLIDEIIDFPKDDLIVSGHSPIISWKGGFYDDQCSGYVARESPMDRDICIKLTIKDDNLLSESELGQLSSKITLSFPELGAQSKGKCNLITSSATDKIKQYTCEYVMHLTVSEAGQYNLYATAEDMGGRVGEWTHDKTFSAKKCAPDLKIKLEGMSKNYVVVKLKDNDGSIISEDSYERSGDTPNVFDFSIPELDANKNYYFDITSSGEYDALGNPISLIFNNKVNTYLLYSNAPSKYDININNLAVNSDICKVAPIQEGPEVCDGRDNDLDGLVDEKDTDGDGIEEEGKICGCQIGYLRDCDTGLSGDCSIGKEECINSGDNIGIWSGICQQSVFAQDEVCDHRDNNCNLLIDEGLLCDWHDCVAGDTRACKCDCSMAQVLLVRDDNHHGEDINDIDEIYSALVDLGVSVTYAFEEDFSTSGFTYNDISSYDLVWFSNPGHPPDDEQSLQALKQYYEEGNPIIIQGDDMTIFRRNSDLIEELTGLINVHNGWDTTHQVSFSNNPHPLLDDLSGTTFDYLDDDIDVTYLSPRSQDFRILATGSSETTGWYDSFGEYAPMPVILIRDQTEYGKGAALVSLLTYNEISPIAYRNKFIVNSVNYLLTLTDKCECEEADPPICHTGEQVCKTDGTWGQCVMIPDISKDVCDYEDNDCDCWPINNGTGVDTNGDGIFCGWGDYNVNEDDICECIDGETRSCGPEYEVSGICVRGTETCINNRWPGTCEGALYGDLIEVMGSDGNCNNGNCGTCDDGLDNDCDGVIDWGGYCEDLDGNGIIDKDNECYAADYLDCSCPDIDFDGICDIDDNCLNTPNGPKLGTCIDYLTGVISNSCDSEDDCLSGECVMDQRNTDFTNQFNFEDLTHNTLGDVCDCIPTLEIQNDADDDCDGVVDDGFDCVLGETQPCVSGNRIIGHCISECVSNNEGGSSWGESCKNIQLESDSFFTPSIIETYETCGDNLDNDCDGLADFDGASISYDTDGLTINKDLEFDPDCVCSAFTEYTKDNSGCYYYIPEGMLAANKVSPSVFSAGEVSLVNVVFDINRMQDFSLLGLGDVSISECRLFGSTDTFNKYFTYGDYSLAVGTFPETDSSSISNTLSIEFLQLADNDENMKKYYELIDLAEQRSRDENADQIILNFECTLDIPSILGSENCCQDEFSVQFEMTTKGRLCEPRICLIKEELNDDIVVGVGNVVDNLLDVIDIANSFCSIIPTLGSIVNQVGISISVTGDVLNKIYPGSGEGMMQAGNTLTTEATGFLGKIWDATNPKWLSFEGFDIFGGEFLKGDYGLKWICDSLITCKHSKDILNPDDPNGFWQNALYYGFGDGATDWLNTGINNLPSALNHLTIQPSNVDPNLAEAGKVPYSTVTPGSAEVDQLFPSMSDEEYEYELGFRLQSGMGSDNLLYSMLTLCLPDVLRNINRYRTAHCTYVECLTTEYPVSTCKKGKADFVCREVVGTLTEFIGVLRLAESIKAALQGLIANWPSILIQNGWRVACDNLPDNTGSSWKLWICDVPRLIVTLKETGETLWEYGESIYNLFANPDVWNQFMGNDLCDELITDYAEYLNDETTGCECYNDADSFSLVEELGYNLG